MLPTAGNDTLWVDLNLQRELLLQPRDTACNQSADGFQFLLCKDKHLHSRCCFELFFSEFDIFSTHVLITYIERITTITSFPKVFKRIHNVRKSSVFESSELPQKCWSEYNPGTLKLKVIKSNRIKVMRGNIYTYTKLDFSAGDCVNFSFAF